ncbi:putative bifunctional diguanylate cyclase/phosphodiesterase [Neoroseomonas rubea]|uniref:putative bifunctional diguanylate cyclase/phosphodiesterase n=1 Tax=Neoroseomonas rubea TaxID=2748666 RepID=UPI0018E009F9|nr:EAL domain-containing protein [Roseomonas rubea]
MIPASLPPDEATRLTALESYGVLDTQAEEVFDQIVRLAARLTGSPIALVSLVDAGRQWFKARHGLDAAETPREMAFCAHAILAPDRPFSVPDATADARFAGNPLVTGAPDIRAYLGVPLVAQCGQAIGTLCVIDRVARQHGPQEIEVISTLASAVMVNLELRRALRRSQEAAMSDALTGLPNRRAATARLAEFIAQGQPVAVVAVDLDHFKETNDAEGHAAGDALLCAAASRLLASVRQTDLVARLGGDEFAVFLIGLDNRQIAESIARQISEALHQPVPFNGKLLRLGATLGVAVAPEDAERAEVVLRAADEALVLAKREGRGGIGWASREGAERLVRAAAVVRTFDAAISEDGATVRGSTAVLQPIIALHAHSTDNRKGTPVLALEALARWSDASLGSVPPAELFPLLGPTRGAVLGRAVRAAAMAVVAGLRADGMTGARVALNLSPAEVARSTIAQDIATEVEAAGLSLDAIELEITEEVLLDRVSDRTLDSLAALRGRGARLVLDDFGTGNSGLAQLLRLPLDAVKLDKRFVQRLGMDDRAEEIVRATVSLAHGLRLSVVAEGVETERQAAIAAKLGCDAAQGFLFARPMPDDQLRDWFSRRSAAAAGVLVPLRTGLRGAGAH